MTTVAPGTVQVWSDLLCPFAYVGLLRFYRARTRLGLDNAVRWTPEDIRENFLNVEMPGDITYESSRDEFLVLSGYRDEDIFYTRVAVSRDRRIACILDVTYPRALKRQFDGIITRMSRSFHVNR